MPPGASNHVIFGGGTAVAAQYDRSVQYRGCLSPAGAARLLKFHSFISCGQTRFLTDWYSRTDFLTLIPPSFGGSQVNYRDNGIGAKSKFKVGWPCHGHLIVATSDVSDTYDDLKVGSPVMITEAPTHVKTADPLPMLRLNNGFVMPGDAGRIISRKPKDVWAIRVKTGAFLLERKYFKPLGEEE